MEIKGLIKEHETIGDRLRYLRVINELKQQDIAKLFLIPVKRVSNLERGCVEINNDELLLYARNFRVSPTWLLTGEDDYEQERKET